MEVFSGSIHLSASTMVLGWKDAGTIIIAHSETSRSQDDYGNAKQFNGAVMSRRNRDKRPVRGEEDAGTAREKNEINDWAEDGQTIGSKKPTTKLKWMQKGLFLVAKGKLKVDKFFSCMSQDQFFDGIDPGSGTKMQALFQANSHLFAKKQQRFITDKFEQVSSSRFGGATSSGAVDTHGVVETTDHEKKRKRRSSSSSGKLERSRSRRKSRKSRSRRRSKDGLLS